LSDSISSESWGRVDETNTVYVRDGDGERVVGQYPDGSHEEALQYFVRKFNDLAGQVTLLEQRIKRGTAGMEARKTVSKLTDQLSSPSVVGDIDSLRRRVLALADKTEEISEAAKAEKFAAREKALAIREAIVAQAEALAAQDMSTVQWKQVSEKLDQLFAEWQDAQKNGAHLPKAESDELWKRFRKARQTLDTARRSYFAQMDATNKEVRARKQELIVAAEALAGQGAKGIPAYRQLLEKWKLAGHASRRVDDQLWMKFKAAGDVLFAAKTEEDSKTDEEFTANLEKKMALLNDSQALFDEQDHAAARDSLLSLQKKWALIGKVPRHAMRDVEGRMKKLEEHVRHLQDAHWKATNPETIARAEGLRGQLEKSIAALETELAEARSKNDAKQLADIEAALEQQRSWLLAIDAS
jgi:hypothetical protein